MSAAPERLQANRDHTKALLLKALLQSHPHQQAVAAQRIKRRQSIWAAKYLLRAAGLAVLATTATLWAGQQIGWLPAINVTIGDQASAPPAATPHANLTPVAPAPLPALSQPVQPEPTFELRISTTLTTTAEKESP